jgi:hypothetical protein
MLHLLLEILLGSLVSVVVVALGFSLGYGVSSFFDWLIGTDG